LILPSQNQSDVFYGKTVRKLKKIYHKIRIEFCGEQRDERIEPTGKKHFSSVSEYIIKITKKIILERV